MLLKRYTVEFLISSSTLNVFSSDLQVNVICQEMQQYISKGREGEDSKLVNMDIEKEKKFWERKWQVEYKQNFCSSISTFSPKCPMQYHISVSVQLWRMMEGMVTQKKTIYLSIITGDGSRIKTAIFGIRLTKCVELVDTTSLMPS